MFEKKIKKNHVFLLEQQKNYPDGKNLTHKQYCGPSTWKDMLKKCVERLLRIGKQKKGKQLCKVSHPCLDDNHFKQEELESIGELSEVCPHIVSKCLYLARIGRPDIWWSVKKLVRSVLKMDSSMLQPISKADFIMYSSHEWLSSILSCRKYRTALADLGNFQDSESFSGALEDSKINLRWCLSQLDVQETNFCFTQFHRIWSYFSGCWTT